MTSIKKLLIMFTFMLAAAMPTARAETSDLGALNKSLSELLAVFNTDSTEANIVFNTIEVLPSGVKEFKAGSNYAKKGKDTNVGFKINASYVNPFDGVTDPITDASIQVDLDIVRLLGQEQVNQMGEFADKLVEDFMKNIGEGYGDSLTATASITNKEVDQNGLKTVSLSVDAVIDLAKLPADKPASDEIVKSFHGEMTLSRAGALLTVHFVSNPGYKGFNKDETGLKEWLEALLRRDGRKLANLVQYVQMLDAMAEQVVSPKAPK